MSAGLREKYGKWLIIGPAVVVVLVIISVVYLRVAFPTVRCEGGKHLDSPEALADCYECHKKATPKVAQDWYESKHGIQLVKCFMCHGQPDGKGALPYAANPDPIVTCQRCHEPSIQRMTAKFGLVKGCAECHPFHQNSIHHETYVKPVAKKTLD
jgi:cytochrome c553